MTDPLLPRPTVARPLNGVSILLVEDSVCYAESLHKMALTSGARLCKVNTLEAGKKALRSFRPHIVMADIGLPDGDGLEIAKVLAELAVARPKLVAISGASVGELEEKALLPGVDAVIAKSDLSLAAFRDVVADLIGQSLSARMQDAAVTPEAPSVEADLRHARDALHDMSGTTPQQIGQFVAALAQLINDPALMRRAERVADQPDAANVKALSDAVEYRLSHATELA